MISVIVSLGQLVAEVEAGLGEKSRKIWIRSADQSEAK